MTINGPDGRERATFRLDLARGFCQGIIETAATTFLLLVAVQYYSAGSVTKALVVSGGPLGLLLSPLAVTLVRQARAPAASGAAWLCWLSAAGFTLAALGPGAGWFVAGSMIGAVGLTALIPLVTQIYQDNYPASRRGRLFSTTVLLRVAATAAFAWLGGRFLDDGIERYRWLLAVFAAASAGSAACLLRMPSNPLRATGSAHPLHAFRHVGKDRVFRWLLVSWMLVGVGNLVMLPLRVDFAANPRYGLALNPQTVALVTGVIPSAVQFVFSRPWGILFDRMNFFLLRIALNFAFIAGILLFFTGPGFTGLVAGACCFGLAMAGGNIAWSLWVTKIAKPANVADYMAVHTMLTGVRGVASPFIGFYLAGFLPIGWLAWGCAILIFLGCVLIAPEVTTLRRRRPAQPLLPKGLD